MLPKELELTWHWSVTDDSSGEEAKKEKWEVDDMHIDSMIIQNKYIVCYLSL